MIGDEIEHQPQAALPEPLAQPGQGRIAAEILMHRVAGDREAGAGDVLLAQVRQRLLKFPAPLRIAARDLLRRQAGLPDAQEPDPVEPHLGQAVQLGVGNVVQRRRPAQRPGQLRQPDAGVDLVQRGIARRWTMRRYNSRYVLFIRPLAPSRAGADHGSVELQDLFGVDTSRTGAWQRAIWPVQPVWWLAPRPAPLSPWKYS